MIETLHIRVTTKAAHTNVEKLPDGTYAVRLTALPTDGQANKQLIHILSKELGIPKSHITIVRGEKSRNKVIEIFD